MNIYDFSVKLANGEEVSMCNYKGKVLLIVNTASK
jgi:glutathione peroxidase